MKQLIAKHIKNIIASISKISLLLITFFAVQIKDSKAQSERTYYELQANLVYNFTNHLTWKKDIKPKVICIIGDNPVIPYLNSLTKQNANIVVQRKYENDYIDECAILFMNKYFKGRFKKLLLKAQNKPIFTISNIDFFAKNGGIIEFTLRNNRVELTINKQSLHGSNIKVSSAILASSEIIN